MGRCLTLNASYEPVALVPVKRAIVLVVTEKAEIVEANLERRFRSEKAEYPYPLVIRLVKYVEIPRRLRKHVTNTILFARDGYRCQYCGRHKSELGRRECLTRDHVKPISRGGGNGWDNVVTACTRCNARKGNRLPMECGMYPKSTPKEPRYVVMVWYSRGLNEVQRRYVEQFYGEPLAGEATA
ncbi:HNH endonuclease [Rubrobacter xylanophilus]|uniref:HNH endonuclease n=1 Tax=Rubrobacter xylanophilus TaxID=49319 RepID=UPI001FCBFA9C|nr:HNH endonuclease [Rubrobacter xylanophilus]